MKRIRSFGIGLVILAGALLMLNGCADLQRSYGVERLGAPIEGYNHSNTAAINRFTINGSGGSGINPSSGGGQTCCVVLPVTWQPGLKVVVEWEEDPTPFSSRELSEKPFTEAWRERMHEQREHYTQHRVEVEVAPYDRLGAASVHFLPCNQVKVTGGIETYRHPDYPYNYPLNMEEPEQCPTTP